MAGVRLRFGVELRTRWRAWLGVALLVAMFGGATMASAAGARRTGTAYARLARSNQAADLVVEDFIPNPDAALVTHEGVAATVGVGEADAIRSYVVEQVSITGGRVGGQARDAGLGSVQLVASPDGRAYGTGLDRPKVLAGRLPDPARTDEVAADFTLPGVGPGQRATLTLDRSLQGDTHQIDQAAGPQAVTFTVVGVVAAPGQFPPQTPNGYYTGSNFYATPAFFAAHRSDLAALEVDLVRVGPGSSATAVSENLQALGSGRPVAVHDSGAQAAEVRRSTHVVALALWVLTALLGVVGLLVLGHLLARMAALEGVDAPTLRAIGMAQGELLVLGVARVGLIGVSGGVLAAVVAFALSPVAPVGIARAAEPNPGLAADWAVLGLGALVVASGCLAASLLPLWRSTGAAGTRGDEARARPSRTVAGLVGGGAPPAMTCGVWMALEPGRGRSAVPVRSSIAGAVIGLAALTAAVTMGASLSHLLGRPALYGVTWDADILSNNGPDGLPAALPVVRSSPDVEAAAFRYAGLTVRLDNGYDTEDVTFIPVSGDLRPLIVVGRAPTGDGEIAVGTRTMDQLHLTIGSTVHGIAENERATPVALRVVGRAVLPPGQFVGRLGIGVVVSEATLQHMADVAGGFTLRRPYIVSVRFGSGVSPSRARRGLAAALTAADPSLVVQVPPEPSDLVNFGRVQNLPLILALILAGLAAAVVAHLLISSVRRRRAVLAMLKTLGFDRRQVRATVAWQATTLAVVAAVVGTPLGIAAGRFAWDLLAGRLGVVAEPVTPVLLLALMLPATVVLANLVAAVPAEMAARVRPAVGLRAE